MHNLTHKCKQDSLMKYTNVKILELSDQRQLRRKKLSNWPLDIKIQGKQIMLMDMTGI